LGWRDTSNGTGAYRIELSPGNYDIMADADGYFRQIIPISLAPQATLPQDFSLTPMSTGTLRGAVWYNDHLVISQVVGSSVTASIDQEFVELFNPSTFTWTIATSPTTPAIDLIYQIRGQSAITMSMTYTNLTVAPGHYYLMANTTTITTNGVTRIADA